MRDVYYRQNEPLLPTGLKRLLIAIVIFVLGLALFPNDAFGFDPPSCGDPWYYQTDDRGLIFMVPDKAQHYWGSYALAEIAQDKLGTIPGAVTAFVLGFLWEVKDSKTNLGTANGGVVGFSYRDLIADGLGVLSSTLANDRWAFYVDYSTVRKEITFNASVRF
jgi:hypothetical protein